MGNRAAASAFDPAVYVPPPLRARLSVLLDRRPELAGVGIGTALDESVRWSA